MNTRPSRLAKAASWVLAGLTVALPAASTRSAESSSVMASIRDFRSAHERVILEEFLELLKIPNIASDHANIRRNSAAVVAMLQRRGLAPQILDSKDTPDAAPLVYGEWKVPRAKRTLVLYAHYDGQPVNTQEWMTPPWEPTLRAVGGAVIAVDSSVAIDPETRLYARGAGDDKDGVVVILSAIDALRGIHRQPTDNLKLVFEGEEEAGSPHLADILQQHQSLLKADLWVVCDGPVHPSGLKEVTYGARGDLNVDLTVYGPNRPLHSGHYGNWAPNPAMRLARLLASMKDDVGHVTIAGWNEGIAPLGEEERRAMAASAQYDDDIRRKLGLAGADSNGSIAEATTIPSLNINGIRSANIGEQAANVIPDRATAVLDLRLVVGIQPQQQLERLLAHVRSQGYYVIDHEPTPDERLSHALIATVKSRPGTYAAFRTPMSDPFAHAIADAVRAASDQPIVELPTSGGSLPLSIIAQSLDTRAIAVSVANFDDNQHAANENLRLGNLWDGIDTYAALLMHRPAR